MPWIYLDDNDDTQQASALKPGASFIADNISGAKNTPWINASNVVDSNDTLQPTVWKPEYICVVPVALFSVDVDTGNIPFTVTFTNDTVVGTVPMTYLWDFGDGNTSTEENPTHEYTVAGNYTVTFTVTNECGSDSATPVVITASNSRVGLLDPYPEDLGGAYGRVLLRGNYFGPFLRLRRSLDSAELDVSPLGYSDTDLDYPAIQAWASGSATISVLKAYDQSSNNRHMNFGGVLPVFNITTGAFYFDVGTYATSALPTGTPTTISSIFVQSAAGGAISISSVKYFIVHGGIGAATGIQGGSFEYNYNQAPAGRVRSGVYGPTPNDFTTVFDEVVDLTQRYVHGLVWDRTQNPGDPNRYWRDGIEQTSNGTVPSAGLGANFEAETFYWGWVGSNSIPCTYEFFCWWERSRVADMPALHTLIAAGA
jgi:PKD repeat protein